ncbi:MAG: hypothetical protein GX927_13515 [Lentisphaerae bacterium]|nr:hypothetical protein [Lentisphaerota bacterium]
MNWKKTTFIALGMAIIHCTQAEQLETPRLRIPLMQKAPQIDGRIVLEEWKGAARMERFVLRGPKAFPGEASFFVGSDGDKLYFAVRSQTPPDGIRQRAMPRPGNNIAVTADDNVEIVIIPDMQAKNLKILHSIINNRGTLYCQGNTGGNPEPWRGNWEVKGTVHDDTWDFEAALPLSDLGLAAGTMPKESGFRICRTWTQLAGGHSIQTSWESAKAVFASRDFIPVVSWDEEAPVVQHTQLKDRASNGYDIRMSIYNPGKAPIQVKADIQVKPVNSQPGEKKADLIIQPEQTVVVDCQGAALDNESLATTLKVSSTDGQKVYYSRFFVWEVETEGPIFSSGNEADSDRLAVNFAYYPSSDAILLQVNTGSLQNKKAVQRVSAVLKDHSGTQLASTDIPLVREDLYEMIWDIPDLKAHSSSTKQSEYSLEFNVDGIPNGKIIRKFVRNILEWEGNPLGKSETIVPPFTPISVNGNTLQTALRKHELNSLGLWAQATAAERSLLKEGGMRLEATTHGKPAKIAAGKLHFIIKNPERVEKLSNFTIGTLKAASHAKWDYDGMMKWTLTLNPSTEPIDSLRLIIPLDNAQMTLMHTCTDGIRINYGGRTPEGEGRVWDGSKCARNSIVGNYVPYIWLGGESRGLSVFGENDRNWSISNSIPCQELIRQGDTLNLVLNLIAEPVTISEKRDILIGFLATPLKPMPENWRKWNMWSWYGNSKIKQFDWRCHFLGSCYYWGAPSACLDIYPLYEDIRFWQELGKTRQSGQKNQAFIDEWISKYPLPGTKGSTAYDNALKNYVNHVNGGFHIVANTKDPLSDPVMFYTNARGVRWDTREGQTFVNEWYRHSFIQRDFKWLSGVAYDLDPVDSFRDYAMWWYKHMFTSGACDAIYWDDVFLNANFNMVTTEAYRLPDGTIQPSTGLFNMRELIRRTAVLQTELGRPARNMVHMTNTAIAPICSFASMNYDWEDHNGFNDFQNRYSKEYIRALSIGRQFGNYPAVLAPVSGTPKQVAWCERTATGVMLTHELRWTDSRRKHYWETLLSFYEFGYGSKEVQVHNYWDENFPFEIDGPDHSSIALVKPGKTLLMICDYGGGGEYRIATAAQATDMESGKVSNSRNGILSVSINNHDYVVLSLEQ